MNARLLAELKTAVSEEDVYRAGSLLCQGVFVDLSTDPGRALFTEMLQRGMNDLVDLVVHANKEHCKQQKKDWTYLIKHGSFGDSSTKQDDATKNTRAPGTVPKNGSH